METKNFLLIPMLSAKEFWALPIPYFWGHDFCLEDGTVVEPIVFKASSKEEIASILKKEIDSLSLTGRTTIVEETLKRFEACLSAIWPHCKDTMPSGVIMELTQQGIYVRGEDALLVRA